MRSHFAAFFVLVVQGLIVHTNAQTGHEHAVVVLNAENFEHATQAASGQTTGYW